MRAIGFQQLKPELELQPKLNQEFRLKFKLKFEFKDLRTLHADRQFASEFVFAGLASQAFSGIGHVDELPRVFGGDLLEQLLAIERIKSDRMNRHTNLLAEN